MFGISLDVILTVASFVLLTIVQTILVMKGRTTDALKLEKKKEESLNKLIAKRNKSLESAEADNEKIKKIKEELKL